MGTSITLSGCSCSDWSDRSYGNAAFEALETSGLPWRRWGTTEPIRSRFDASARAKFLETWNKDLSSPFASIAVHASDEDFLAMFTGTHGPRPHASSFSLCVPRPIYADMHQQLQRLSTTLFCSLHCCHGYVGDDAEYDAQHYSEKPLPESSATQVVMLGIGYRECLPGVYWGNYFGPPVTDWIGEDRIRSCPCHEHREIAPGYHFLVAYQDILKHDSLEAIAAKDEIRAHLGVERFYDRRHPDRKTTPPPLDWSELYRPPPGRDKATEAALRAKAREMGGWAEIGEGEMRLHLDGSSESQDNI